MNDIVDVAWKVALEHVGVAYYLGGSVASSLQATARSTNDIDFVVELAPSQVRDFARELGEQFSVDEEALEEAARLRTSRRRRFRIDFDIDPFVKSTEDSILKKLQWFNAGGRVSSTQWRDVVELLRVNRGRLDEAYLARWSVTLGLEDQLAAARRDALSAAQ